MAVFFDPPQIFLSTPYASLEMQVRKIAGPRELLFWAKHKGEKYEGALKMQGDMLCSEIEEDLTRHLSAIRPPPIELDNIAARVISNPELLPPRFVRGSSFLGLPTGPYLHFNVRVTAQRPLAGWLDAGSGDPKVVVQSLDKGGAVIDSDDAHVAADLRAGERGTLEFAIDTGAAARVARFRICVKKKAED